MLIKPLPFIISSFPSSSSWLRELANSNYHAKIFLICDDFFAKSTDTTENARGNQRPQVPIERLARGGWTVFLYLILVVLTILWVYVILSRLMGRRDICSDKNYDKMSFGEDYIREQEGGSTTDKRKKKKKKEGDYSCSLFFLRNPLPANKISTFKSECKQVKDKEKAR